MTEWDIDEGNEWHVTRHGVTLDQLDQTLQNPFRVAANRKHRMATHLFIGQDDGGAGIAVAMLATSRADLWRPIAAWYCKPNEWARLPRR